MRETSTPHRRDPPAARGDASDKGLPIVTATAVNWRLQSIVDAPVMLDDEIIVLRYSPDRSGNGGWFSVRPVA